MKASAPVMTVQIASDDDSSGESENIVLDTQRDSVDFRDKIYQPSLNSLSDVHYPDHTHIRILNQGREGACTGFGLAATINYLNQRRKVHISRKQPVSPRMLYEMAKRYDRWPGEDYDGSSCRGAMKGWFKHGVCGEELWPYVASNPGHLTPPAREDAARRPLGGYYRIVKNRTEIQAAIEEAGAVFASAKVHSGWSNPRNGQIPTDNVQPTGGHAFCILGYDEDGFIIQNSWGPGWGGITLNGTQYEGLARWTYDDFEDHLWDAWVAQIAPAVKSSRMLTPTGGITHTQNSVERVEKAPPRHEIADDFIHIDDGRFDPEGDFYSHEEEVAELIRKTVADAAGKHIMIYAHGGLNSVKSCASRTLAFKPVMEANGIQQIHLIWETGLFAELRDIIFGKQDKVEKRAGGLSDHWDSLIEKITQPLGHALWREMQDDADLAFQTDRAGDKTLAMLRDAMAHSANPPKLHLAGHSAGSILLGHMIQAWDGIGGTAVAPFETLQLMAPACTMDFYSMRLKPEIGPGKAVRRLYHYQMDDDTERDDNVAFVYRKSLLYLVSHSYENKTGTVPIMGMQKYWTGLTHGPEVTTYNCADNSDETTAESHMDFDNDVPTMNTVLSHILGGIPPHPFTKGDLDY